MNANFTCSNLGKDGVFDIVGAQGIQERGGYLGEEGSSD